MVLPVLNEDRDIERLLDEVLGQVEPPGGFEVLVADGGSTDRTREIVAEVARTHPNVRLIQNRGRLSSAGRNAGARMARGEYVLFLDGHCSIPRNDYLLRVIEIFENTGAACLCRPQYLTELADGEWASAIATARHSWFGHNFQSDIYGGPPGSTNPRSAGAAYRRECLETLGGYDERFDACEDVEFNHRIAVAGFKSYRHPDLRIGIRPRSSLRALYHQMFRYGRGRARLMARHPSVVPWPLVGITGLLAAGLLAGLFINRRLGLLLIGIPSVAWVLIMLIESLRLNRRTPSAAIHRTFLAFVTIYGGLVLGFWRGVPEMPAYRSPAKPPEGASAPAEP